MRGYRLAVRTPGSHLGNRGSIPRIPIDNRKPPSATPVVEGDFIVSGSFSITLTSEPEDRVQKRTRSSTHILQYRS